MDSLFFICYPMKTDLTWKDVGYVGYIPSWEWCKSLRVNIQWFGKEPCQYFLLPNKTGKLFNFERDKQNTHIRIAVPKCNPREHSIALVGVWYFLVWTPRDSKRQRALQSSWASLDYCGRVLQSEMWTTEKEQPQRECLWGRKVGCTIQLLLKLIS